MEKVIIIGGGVAGLSCLNELLDQDESPLLLEEKTIGLPKICGEFIAPLASQQLQKWGIGPIQPIKEACFIVNKQQLKIPFNHPAGAFSRVEAELGLAKRAYEKGGRIREQVHIAKISPPLNNFPYTIHLDSGEQIVTKAVIFATGKLNPHISSVVFPYQGFKIHVPQILKEETLFMIHHSGAYFGMVPISAKVSNLTCLAQNKVVESWGSCKDFFYHLKKVNPLLNEIDISSIQWLEGKAPEFKAQVIPDWENAFWIGDALASFYPAIGYGFGHSVNSATWAAHFYLHADARRYTQFIQNEIKQKLWLGKLMHRSFMNPTLSQILLSMIQKSPRFIQFLMSKLGYN